MTQENTPNHRHDSTGEINAPRKITSIAYLFGTAALCTFSLSIGHSGGDVHSMSYNFNAASASTEQNNATTEIVDDLTGTDVRAYCNDESLDDQDRRYPLVEDGRRFMTAGMVVPTSLPFGIEPDVITLREGICDTIVGFDPTTPMVTEDSPTYQEYKYNAAAYASSLSIALHEVEHTRGVLNEAQAECNAIQKLPEALEEAGMSEFAAEDTAKTAAITQAASLLKSYLSKECRPGGEYDLGISDVYISSDMASQYIDY